MELMDKEELVRRAWEIEIEGKRPRGRPKLRIKDVVQQDSEARGLRKSDAQGRGIWRNRLRHSDPKQGIARGRRRITIAIVLIVYCK